MLVPILGRFHRKRRDHWGHKGHDDVSARPVDTLGTTSLDMNCSSIANPRLNQQHALMTESMNTTPSKKQVFTEAAYSASKVTTNSCASPSRLREMHENHHWDSPPRSMVPPPPIRLASRHCQSPSQLTIDGHSDDGGSSILELFFLDACRRASTSSPRPLSVASSDVFPLPQAHMRDSSR